jgi:hypothetical protein
VSPPSRAPSPVEPHRRPPLVIVEQYGPQLGQRGRRVIQTQ